MIHVNELTQPQGHSTSGSHERYKTSERLKWEQSNDCNTKFREWIISNDIATDEFITSIERDIKKRVKQGKLKAWKDFCDPIKTEKEDVLKLMKSAADASSQSVFIQKIIKQLESINEPLRNDILSRSRNILKYLIHEDSSAKSQLINWVNSYFKEIQPKYSTLLYSESESRATNIREVLPVFDSNSKLVDGRVILRDNFDKILGNKPEVLIFGEDTGTIGDVNQGLEGLQEKFGEVRVSDTGIRETTIIGQGIGLALRGLRPIAEIQYLDYMVYALQIISDDLSTLHYRTFGKQKAPMIIRTRGHRLEGIWHSGSQLGGILNLIRGVYVLVPRNMTKAAGFYNTLLESDQPAMVVECLNGYRLKEKEPSNLGEFRTPVGIVETIKEGADLTIVSYGSTLRIIEKAAKELQEVDIDVEIIDIQSLIPFDLNKDISKSVKKTNRLLIIDEDVPGAASAYILNEILQNQNIYEHLDSKPQLLTAKEHRPAYGSDGDYFSKPSSEDVFETVYNMFHEVDPSSYPKLR
jgi:pyruvate/2-oxoglutarate/acetoin dehydrogenase E1 component